MIKAIKNVRIITYGSDILIKYFEALEKPNNFYLTFEDNPSDGFFSLQGIALNFIDKYGPLISRLNDIDFFIRSFNTHSESLKLALKNYFDNQGNFNTELYKEDYSNISDLIKMQENMPSIEITKDLESWLYILDFYIMALQKIFYFHPYYKKLLNNDYQLLINARSSLRGHSEFIIKHSKKADQDINLPNSWYITNYGDLYNAFVVGHSETATTSPFETIKWHINYGEALAPSARYLLTLIDSIRKTSAVSFLEYSNYINANLFPVRIATQYDNFGLMMIYDPKIVMLTLGVISAQAGLYGFFEYFQRNVRNPELELSRLEEMTRCFLSDTLVRCAGFHKVETNLSRTITTSSLTPFEDLKAYVESGWDVYFIPPIIVNKEKGRIEELSIGYNIAGRHLEEDIIKYELAKKHERIDGRIHY